MKLSASLYSNKNLSLLDSARELEPYKVDFWHIDSIEDLQVFDDIDKLKEVSRIPIDLHIISKTPEKYCNHLEKKNIGRVSIQIEDVGENFQFPNLNKKEVGMAIQINHPKISEMIEKYREQVDFVLLMMTTPGKSGGKFQKESFSDIRSLVNTYPKMNWSVDGGVDHEISYILRLIGVQSVVVGSYLLNHENMAEAIINIRSNRVRSEYKVSDFQIPLDQLPVVKVNESVVNMLEKMNNYNLGVVFCVDEDNQFRGIITNADVRKVLIDGSFSYELNLHAFINSNPKRILDTQSTAEMLDYITNISFPILVLPIISKNGTLTGAISFHKLLKEE